MKLDEKQLTTLIANIPGLKASSNLSHRLFLAFIYGVCLGILFTLTTMILDSSNESKDIYGKRISTDIINHTPENINLADYLYAETKVMCIVILNNLDELNHKIFYIDESWTKRCNRVLFAYISIKEFDDSQLKTGRKGKDVKVFTDRLELFKHIEESDYFDSVDWFLYTNENSFIVLENLRHMLYAYEASLPIFIAHQDEIKAKSLHGACIFSKTTLMKLNRELDDVDDKSIYESMIAQNVTLLDTRDEDKRERFFLKDPEKHIFPANSTKFTQEYVDTCCSSKLIALHGMWGASLLKYDYYIYRVHAFGIKKNLDKKLPQKLLYKDHKLSGKV